MYKLHTCTPGRLSDSVFIIFMCFLNPIANEKMIQNVFMVLVVLLVVSCFILKVTLMFSSSFLPSLLVASPFFCATSVLVVVCHRVCFTGSCSSVFECLLVYVFYFFFLAFSLSSLLL